MIDKEIKKRSPAYVATVAKKDDVSLRLLAIRLRKFNARLRLLKEKYELITPPQARWVAGFTEQAYLKYMPRLGKDNPNAQLYSRVNGPFDPRHIAAKHAARFDVYVSPRPFLCGYELTDDPDIEPKFNERKMLHCDNGPAMRLEGFTFYYWHGIQCERDTIMRDYPFEEVMQIENAETRRIVMERIGWDKLIDKLEPIIVDADDDPEVGTLIEIINPMLNEQVRRNRIQILGEKTNWNTWRFIRVRCGTGRTFAIRVPHNIQSALEAQAWIWNIPIIHFQKPEVRT